ncbi:unnamed protein product [Parnassius mnemosyne]|uniref:Sec16 Sec23-binding domain-containing protein n=1 Tax=Parnassius mnemosyne TaxID=213953 RepID=A0AAV1LZ01_9NEOP
MKRAQGGAPPPAAEQPLYDAPQPYGNQQNMYSNYQSAQASTQQQQYWQMQQQQPQNQYNQQYGQTYQQQDYGNNANQIYQQPPQYNQNFPNQTYTNTQQGYPQNYYANQALPQQNYAQNKMHNDGWEDNWDWGWEDSSKQKPTLNQAVSQEISSQSQVCNNANVIEESFAPSNTWNWAMENKKEPQENTSSTTVVAQENKESSAQPTVNTTPDIIPQTESVTQGNVSNPPAQFSTDEIKTLNDREVVKERLPNLALGKRFHIDNLTPQWSIESQMSQDSSDGPQTHSEGTYRSENQSRNSSKSSPGLNTDNSHFNYSQSRLDEMYPQSSEWSKLSNEDTTLIDSHKSSSRRESHDDLSSSMQDMNICNTENAVPHIINTNNEFEQNTMENMPPPVQLPTPISSAESVKQVSSNIPPTSNAMPPPPPVSTATQAPPTVSSTTMPPPTNFPPSLSQNPFKHAGPFSHKNISKANSNTPSQIFPPQMPNSNLTSPAVVNKISHHNRMPIGFGANLETTPDNSERPDQPQATNFRQIPVTQQIPDNLEVAPQNDRNEYLQTEHLSSVDYGENTDFSQNAPPPGLRRMVVGQQETEYSQNLNISGDEPPPGLARMVPGQQTESDNGYNQPNENYIDRHADGQLTENTGRPFRQADGQQTSDNFTQPPTNRVTDRRPIGLDRMVPGESSNNEYMQYQVSNYGGSTAPRVVTGVDHDYPLHTDAGPTDVREQNVDGSDYTEPTTRNTTRNIIGLREQSNDTAVDFSAAPEEQQREVTMEGENLQDLSIISGAEMTFSREQMFDVVSGNVTDLGTDRGHNASDSVEYPANNSRRQSVNRVNTSGDDSERDRTFKSSPRRDREKHKSSRDRDRDRERDKEGRYSRGDRKYDRDPDRRLGRDGQRSEKDRRDRDRDKDRERRDRDISPDTRRHRRSTRSHRYETEDTDYYSDKERDRRRYREGSYSSKPPRPDDKELRHDDRRRHNTKERETHYDEESGSRRRSDRHRDRYERRYRDIDPNRKYGNLRREEEDRRRVVTFSKDAKSSNCETYSSPSRAGSREATATDEDMPEPERRRRDRDRDRDRRSRGPRDVRDTRDNRDPREPDPYYLAGYGGGTYGDPFALQRQQYSYYERLRRTDPAAYMRLYKQLMAGQLPAHSVYAEGYSSLGYDMRAEERGSVHSGRSSTNGLKGNDTDLNTDASLNLHLEESTVRSERMTPFKFSTAHIKGSISARHVVVVPAGWPADGRPAAVRLLPLHAAAQHDPALQHLLAYPGPLARGVTHKKSVIDYCTSRISNAGKLCALDPLGYVLVWELLALLLRQNGVVVGSDIAELLMKNTREYEYKGLNKITPRSGSRRESSVSAEGREEERISSPEQPSVSADLTPPEEESSTQSPLHEKAALDRLREYLIYGNRQEALEWAMTNNLWGHALQLAAYSERRVRAGVASRFLASVPRSDPLHTLYAALAQRLPPAATCAAEEKWGDWRPHAAIMLSNSSAKPEHDRRALTQLGDSLASRGLVYCAQFCYVSSGVPFARHPLAPLAAPAAAAAAAAAPPRLSLLLADPRATTLNQLATNEAIFATEIYEYALSLSHEDYVIDELQVYKLVAACRLLDLGQVERALGYVERAARAVTRAPRAHPAALPARLALLADRLKYYDPALHEDPPLVDDMTEGDSAEPSPRHHQQWLDDVKNVASMLEAETRQQSQHGNWHEQTTLYQQPVQTYPKTEETPDYAAQYYHQQDQLVQQSHYAQQDGHYSQTDGQYVQQDQSQESQEPGEQLTGLREGDATYTYGEEWPQEQAQNYADPYWQNDSHYGYGEAVTGLADNDALESRPTITMPGTAPSKPSLYADYDDDRPASTDVKQTERDTDSPRTNRKQESEGQGQSKGKEERSKGEGKGKSGWLGGILTKLSLRAPNQMILPDDKNPTIVWDAEHKRWRNLDGDDEPAAQPPPPPAVPLARAPAPPQNSTAGAPPPVSNIFKMQKGRHIKKSYVDVFNPSGAATRPLPPAAELLGASLPPAPSEAPNYFVPAPTQSGFYDPTQMTTGDDDQYRSGI